jgi:hypothetical protein
MLDFKKRMVVVQKEKVLLLVDNFLGHNMANIASKYNKSLSAYRCTDHCIIQSTVQKAFDSKSNRLHYGQ